MRKLIIPKRETKFQDQILNCSNQTVATIVSEYSKNEKHFIELYQIGISKWKEIETNFSEKNINKSGALIIRQEILNYTLEMENKELKKLKNEVAEFYTKLGNELNMDINYKIFFSKFSENAEILFIGINPGAGEQIKNTNAEEIFEYLLDYNYPLLKDTVKAFKEAGYPNLLEKLDKENKIVKINSIYYVDKEIIEGDNIRIDDFTNLLSKEQHKEFYQKSYDWTYKMIQLIKPKLIICEGKIAYTNVYIGIPTSEINKIDIGGVFITKYENLEFTMLSYSRKFPSSGIKNLENFSEVLKIELDKIYK